MRRFWKIYAGAYAAFLAVAAFWMFQAPRQAAAASWDEKLAFLSAALGLVGLLGYAYGRRIVGRWLWVAAFALALFSQVTVSLYPMLRNWAAVQDYLATHPDLALLTFGVWAFLLPYFIGLFLYAFRDPVWRQAPSGTGDAA
jgi:hypothetical protein